MKVLQHVVGIMTIMCLTTPTWSWAQSPAPQRRVRPAAPKPTEIIVRDVSGTPLEGVKMTASGTARAEASTNDQGIAAVVLADGGYRLRFEKQGFLTLERDVTVRNIRPSEILVALNRAPLPTPPPPAPEPTPAPVPVATVGTVGPSANVSIPLFLDKNFVGRDPLKESILGCMPDATARLLQLREAVAAHTHADLDEVLYVVAGEGAVRIGSDDWIALSPGSMTAIPRGTQHAFARRGKTPLVMLSTLAGAPCTAAAARAGSK